MVGSAEGAAPGANLTFWKTLLTLRRGFWMVWGIEM